MITWRIRRLVLALAAVATLAVTPLVTAASAATPTASTSSTVPAAAVAAPMCTANDLGVWVATDQSQGAAGTIYTPLEFTNLSRRACTLRGFPGVSAISSSGQQLGSPAAWDNTVKATTVRLAPGSSAYAMLAYSDVVTGNCPKPNQITAFELRIYPPNQYGTDHAFWSLPTCTAKGSTSFMRVRVIAPGIGVIGSSG
jgi:hypothetical protein